MSSSSKLDESKLFSLRVENLPRDVRTEDIVARFAKFGGIASHYRPTNLNTGAPCPFLFVRYFIEHNALEAQAALDGMEIDGHRLAVKYAKQKCTFTQDTGYITNTELDNIKVVETTFDSSLPLNHYAKKREAELKTADVVYTVRVDDLPENITPEELNSAFRQFGEIVSIYLPFDLKTRKYKNFGFVRYLSRDDAMQAAASMNNVNLGRGRNILASVYHSKTYFSQDETHFAA